MLVVSREVALVRELSSGVALMAEGRVAEIDRPRDVLDGPREARTREFVSRILRHWGRRAWRRRSAAPTP